MRRKRNKAKPTLQQLTLDIGGTTVPVRIYKEYRYNVRASIGKTAAFLRMPHGLHAHEEERHLNWFKDWLHEQVAKSDRINRHFGHRAYQDGDTLEVGKKQYRLAITYEDRKTHSGKLLPDGTIALKLSHHDQGPEFTKRLQHLLSRIVAQDFLPEITRRVDDLNDRFFQQNIGEVRLKYNHSNWGSCSSKGNINLSTRLLFAPDDVIDYVIIHELAHRIEMNHSPRFWKLVSDAMPDYKEKEKWLKVHGGKLGF
ncbi:M48 family metallopeptidase [Phaeodactylibacter xiamenensis]|uniref:M48 family metallopeptidase n=1 Tax=Phaeodactylibacter xiamenensis TaxID=1524460 RepID=UPI0024A9AF51|nr:M48 family metallopeptidase [Phaeodactylibacter xiamenensis]